MKLRSRGDATWLYWNYNDSHYYFTSFSTCQAYHYIVWHGNIINTKWTWGQFQCREKMKGTQQTLDCIYKIWTCHLLHPHSTISSRLEYKNNTSRRAFGKLMSWPSHHFRNDSDAEIALLDFMIIDLWLWCSKLTHGHTPALVIAHWALHSKVSRCGKGHFTTKLCRG